MSFKKFVHNNLVAIVIIPTIIAVHWGCNKIQNMDQFVSESERKDMPIIRVAKLLKDQWTTKVNSLMGSKNE